MENARESIWLEQAPDRSFPPLPGDVEADVAVIGGGLAGLTAALLLQQEGKRVVLLEAGVLASGVTGYTTAHLTEALDIRYHALAKSFGWEGARLAAQAQRAAIDTVFQLSRSVPGAEDCDLRSLPGYLFAEDAKGAEDLARESEATRKIGLATTPDAAPPLPFPVRAALRFDAQAQFHPLRYLLPLARRIVALGGAVHEQTRVLDVHDGSPCVLQTAQGTVKARDVVVATHTPISDKFFLHTKVAQYRSYVVAARQAAPLAGLFWDTADPYHYVRSQPVKGGHALIVGGADHKVGQKTDTEAPYRDLKQYVRAKFPAAGSIDWRWSAQVVETVDGLPYIGRDAVAHHVWIATGFSGNGMTNGTAAALLLRDLVLGRPNPWADLFQATRVKPASSAMEWVRENVDYPLHMALDRLAPADAKAIAQIPPGGGGIVALASGKVAVSRDDAGKPTALSPVCTHMGCLVGWNPAERSWDCPCHGARFNCQGEVINGPAVKPLAPHDL